MFIWLLIELAAGGEEEVHGRVGGWRYVLVVENGTVTAHALECTVRRIIGISPVRPDPGNWVYINVGKGNLLFIIEAGLRAAPGRMGIQPRVQHGNSE